MTNDEIEYSYEGDGTSYSSSSETRSRLNETNPFGSVDDNNKKVKTNILSLEKTTSTESSLTSSSQSAQAESSNEVYDDFNGDGFDDLAIGVAAKILDLFLMLMRVVLKYLRFFKWFISNTSTCRPVLDTG